MADFEVWHDEHRGDDSVNEYWHGILFIPSCNKLQLISYLKQIRDKHSVKTGNDLKFSGVLKSGKNSGVINNSLSLFAHSLIVRADKASSDVFHLTNKDKYQKECKPYLKLQNLIGCKFVLFHIPNNHANLTGYPMTYAERVETTFRIGFKGGAHLLFSDENKLNVTRFCFDGHEHHGRNIDINRITKGDFRNYCTFSNSCTIDDRQIKMRNDDTKIVMSFVDIITGALVAKIKEQQDPSNILFPLDEIYKRLIDNKIILNPNSKWHKSISVSKLEVVNGEIKFPPFFENKNQLSLFD